RLPRPPCGRNGWVHRASAHESRLIHNSSTQEWLPKLSPAPTVSEPMSADISRERRVDISAGSLRYSPAESHTLAEVPARRLRQGPQVAEHEWADSVSAPSPERRDEGHRRGPPTRPPTWAIDVADTANSPTPPRAFSRPGPGGRCRAALPVPRHRRAALAARSR